MTCTVFCLRFSRAARRAEAASAVSATFVSRKPRVCLGNRERMRRCCEGSGEAVRECCGAALRSGSKHPGACARTEHVQVRESHA
jgi:hypothetical protein